MMKRAVILSCLLLAFAAGIPGVRAAAPVVRATLKPDTVLIGDRFSIEVLIDKDMMQVVELPTFGTDMTGGGSIEILSESPLDTLRQEGRRQVLRKRYELTSFDAGIYELGHYPVLYGDKNITDTLYSQAPLRIVVDTFPVDTQKSTVYDIKGPEQAPLMVGEFAGYAAAILVFAAVLAAVVIQVCRYRARRRGTVPEGRSVPVVPPHVQAIQDLETLHNRKLWQSGRVKSYYTQLTDIVRAYLNGRYGVNAMEMTSDEIMGAAAALQMSDKNRRDLRAILLTADLVKFARHVPAGEENENLYYAAYYFVEDTKEVPAEADGGEKEENDGKESR